MDDGMTRRTALAAAGAATLMGVRAAAQTGGAPATPKAKRIGIVLFDRFETLDVFGPVQMWGRLKDHGLVMVSEKGGAVASAQGVKTLCDHAFADAPQFDILMIPGGAGTRTEVNNPAMLDFLRRQDRGTQWTTSVCTGSAVLAKAGILDGRKATTNKRAYAWATGQSQAVQWQPRARWVVDGKYVTSSGVSAGTDMALGLVATLYGREEALSIAQAAEYQWQDDPNNDPFAVTG
jgi:putative intracellular protease/amidase